MLDPDTQVYGVGGGKHASRVLIRMSILHCSTPDVFAERAAEYRVYQESRQRQ